MSRNLQPILYNIVCQLYKERVQNKQFPYIAVEKDIKAEVGKLVSTELAEMVSDGILQCHENVNGIKMYAPANADEIDFNDIS